MRISFRTSSAYLAFLSCFARFYKGFVHPHVFLHGLLLQAGDVEANPGPTQDEEIERAPSDQKKPALVFVIQDEDGREGIVRDVLSRFTPAERDRLTTGDYIDEYGLTFPCICLSPSTCDSTSANEDEDGDGDSYDSDDPSTDDSSLLSAVYYDTDMDVDGISNEDTTITDYSESEDEDADCNTSDDPPTASSDDGSSSLLSSLDSSLYQSQRSPNLHSPLPPVCFPALWELPPLPRPPQPLLPRPVTHFLPCPHPQQQQSESAGIAIHSSLPAITREYSSQTPVGAIGAPSLPAPVLGPTPGRSAGIPWQQTHQVVWTGSIIAEEPDGSFRYVSCQATADSKLTTTHFIRAETWPQLLFLTHYPKFLLEQLKERLDFNSHTTCMVSFQFTEALNDIASLNAITNMDPQDFGVLNLSLEPCHIKAIILVWTGIQFSGIIPTDQETLVVELERISIQYKDILQTHQRGQEM